MICECDCDHILYMNAMRFKTHFPQILSLLAATMTMALSFVCVIDYIYSRPLDLPLREAARHARRIHRVDLQHED